MIIQTLSTNEVAHILLADDYAKWSYEAATTLAEYYDDLSDDLGESWELDITAIRCDWSEYDNDDLLNAYGHLIDLGQFKDDNIGDLVEVLGENTTIVELTNTFLVMDF